MGKGYTGKACATGMYVYVHVYVGVEAQGRIRPRKKSGMLTNPSGTASHDEDPDLQCSRSPGELIEADSIPVGAVRHVAFFCS